MLFRYADTKRRWHTRMNASHLISVFLLNLEIDKYKAVMNLLQLWSYLQLYDKYGINIDSRNNADGLR
jgi:hypothetical protein